MDTFTDDVGIDIDEDNDPSNTNTSTFGPVYDAISMPLIPSLTELYAVGLG